jgi:hypothetical protein
MSLSILMDLFASDHRLGDVMCPRDCPWLLVGWKLLYVMRRIRVIGKRCLFGGQNVTKRGVTEVPCDYRGPCN